ncbi:MAG TPA: hypothetical protein VK473_10040 [Terriglobales bacterium]|nr:hypothetical protein [Terriglobales bacterium]
MAAKRVLFLSCLTLLALARVPAMALDSYVPLLDQGFRFMYNLEFESAQRQFGDYQREHPEDPLGPVSEAAGCLFSELNRLGILQAQMFVKDSTWMSRTKLTPDPVIRDRFYASIMRAQQLADKRLKGDANDQGALFAATLTAGLNSDYAALIEKKNVASLTYTRQATEMAQRLLKVCPDCYDAYVATGISQYLIGSLSAPFRWMLRLGGFSGDKQKGISELQLAADKGHYLAPFARMLLAIAYLREKQPDQARVLLAGLRADFPGNTLFAHELARLDSAQP